VCVLPGVCGVCVCVGGHGESSERDVRGREERKGAAGAGALWARET